MKRVTGVIIVLFFEVLFVRLYLACRELKDFFYFSFFNITLIINEQVHNDTDIPIALVRAFHNKITVTVVEFIRHYLYFWDIRFLVPFISPLGVFCLCIGFWYLMRSKIKGIYKIVFLVLVLTIPLIEMSLKPQFPPVLRTILLASPYAALSAFGAWHFLSSKERVRQIIFLVLGLFSLWWFFVFSNEIFNFCVKL